MHHTGEKLGNLRILMKNAEIDAYLITATDPHLEENIPDHWRIIQWLTGFAGSAATVVVTDSFAGFWTDSRYYIQAQSELMGSGFTFMKPEVNADRDLLDWLAGNLRNNSTVGFDGRILSEVRFRKIQMYLQGKGIGYNYGSDLISEIWTVRPPMPDLPAWDLPVIYTGKERSAKIAEVRALMKDRNIDHHLLTSPDDIMWLLNIRGSDVKFSPLLTSFAVIDDKQILLFADENKIQHKMAKEFDTEGIVILPYEEIAGILSTLPSDSSLLLSPSSTSVSLFNSIPRGMRVIEDFSIPGILKMVKNKVEIENIGEAMLKDGIALTRFLYWFDQDLGSLSATELSLSQKLDLFRFEQTGYIGPSFQSIVAFNEHSALPHYTPTIETDVTINPDGILLIDSGGQYLNGTTDITRTIATGSPTAGQKRDFTLVLKGNIALARAKIPAGTRGIQLDILARKALWESGLNYGHGTGHGVGFCLNVHEGPLSISAADNTATKTPIEPGMLISNEPAVYREGQYGIRIENLILCYEDEETEFDRFLKFDTLSLCHIDRSLIDISLLDENEIEWLNRYQAGVYEKLNHFLTEGEKLWLKAKTEPV